MPTENSITPDTSFLRHKGMPEFMCDHQKAKYQNCENNAQIQTLLS